MMQSIKMSWTPDESLFEMVDGDLRGIHRVKEVLNAAGLDTKNRIITSRDTAILPLIEKLRANIMPLGFEQYQLPLLLPSENTMYFITVGQPKAKFPEHRHTYDDGLRVIISGSIIYDGTELIAGDWMFVPRGSSYTFEVGDAGCTVFHAYAPPPKSA